MDPVQITQAELLTLLGAKEVEIYALRRQLQQALASQPPAPPPDKTNTDGA
mgnify:FL=1